MTGLLFVHILSGDAKKKFPMPTNECRRPRAVDNVARIVTARLNLAPVVVVAMGGVTDALLASVMMAADGQADEAPLC